MSSIAKKAKKQRGQSSTLRSRSARCEAAFHLCAAAGAVALIAAATPHAAQAATQTWTGATSGTWETTTNWSATTPGSSDLALWDTPSTANLSITLGAPESVLGLKVINPSGAVAFSGSTLTIGTGGIDMSAATQNLTINSGLTLGAGNQTWNVATGQTLTLTGALTRSTGATLLIDKSTNTGIVTASPTLVNSLVGPWAIVKNNTTAASNNTANGYTFATVTGGNIVAYTGATPETSAASAWGGIGSGNNSTVNYDLSATGSYAVTGVQRNVNTIRFTGTAAASQVSNGNASNLLITNGIMNAGGGQFAIGGGSKFLGIQIGTTNELVLAAETAGITINNSIQNNGASNGVTAGGTGGTASALTIVGAGGNAVILAGASTYTGVTTINTGGSLQLGNAGTTGAISTSSAITDNGAFIINRTNAVAQGTDFSGSAISGSGGLTQAGTGTTTFSGANTYTGPTTVSAGTLKAGVVSVANVSGAFGNNSAVTLANVATAVLDITGFNTQLGSIAGGGPTGGNVTLGAAALTTGGDNTSTTYAGVISGAGGSFTKIGSGTQTLTGTSSYTGATTISAGTLTIGGTGMLGSGSYAGNISNAGAFNYSSSANQTFSGGLTGNGTLTKDTSAASTLTLSGSYSYTGATSINAGALIFAGVGSLGSVSVADSATLGARLSSTSASAVAPTTLTFGTSGASNFAVDFNSLSNPSVAVVAASGTLTLNGTVNVSLANAGNLGSATNSLQLMSYASQAGAGAFNLTTTSAGHTTFSLNDTATALYLNVSASTNIWTGATSNSWDIGTPGGGSGSHNWSLSDHVYLDGDVVAFDDTASQFNVNIASTVSPSGVTFSNSSAHTYTLSGSGIAGSGALTLNGTNGTVVLTNANTYTGITTIGSGDTLQLGDGTTDGSINSSVSITDNGTLIYNRSTGSSFTYANAISGTGALTKSGSGTQILTSSNSYSGVTTITAGTLQLGNGGTTGALSSSSVITDNGTLAFNRSNAVVQGTDFSTAAITGTGAVTQLGSGTLTLNAANSFSGGVNINAGTVSVANVGNSGANSNLGTNGTINIGATTTGGTLLYTGTGETSDKVINLAGTTGGATIDQSGTGLLKFSSALTATGVGAKILTLQGSTAGTGELGGSIVDSSSGATSVTKAGTNTWTLSGSNTYTGGTTISGGTLSFQGGSALPGGSAISLGSGTLQVLNNGSGSSGAITLGNSVTINSATTTDTINVGNNGSNTANTVAFGALSNGTSANANAVTINFTGANGYLESFSGLALSGSTGQNTTLNPTTTSVTITGNVTNQLTSFSGHFDTLTLDGTSSGNVINGAILNSSGFVSVNNGDTRITKQNSSVWTLAGNNTYSGPTSVSGGILILSGANNNGTLATTSVSNGATLQLQANNGNTSNFTTASTALGTASGKLTLNDGATLQLRSDTNVTFNGTDALGGLNGRTITIDVNNITAGTANGATNGGIQNQTLSLATATTAIGTTGQFNITGGNGYTLAFGPLQTGNGSGNTETFNPTSASATIASYNNGNGTFNTVSLAGTSTGNAILGAITNTTGSLAVTKSGTSTWTLPGANNYSGITTISAGTLQIGAGTTSGQLGSGSVLDNAALVFSRSDTATVANLITGSGSLIQAGSGTTILSNNNTYSGSTSITAGTLDVTGAISNSTAVTVDATTASANLVLDAASALSSSAGVTGQNLGTLSFVPTITVNTNQSFASLVNSGSTTFAGNSTSTIGSVGGTGTIVVTAGSMVNASSAFNHGALVSDGNINVNGGTNNIVGTVDGAGTLTVAGANLTATYFRQGGLSVGPTSSATIAFDSQAHTGGTPTHTSVVTTLSVDPAGTLDLTNNGIVILDTTSLGAVASLVTQAADVTGGHAHWDMPGITSSTAAGDPPTPTSAGHAVGYGLASAISSTFTSFNGITFSDAVIARYTLVGDHSLKGSVDLSDYTIVIKNLGLSGKTWTDGNFDYSGNVNLSDYTAVIKNIGRSDGQGVFTATGPSAQQVKASSLTLHTAPAVTQASTATDVTLLVNPTNGRVTLINALQTGQAVITAYTINSSSGSLVTFSQDSNGKYLATAIENNPGVFYQSSNGGTFNRWTGIKNVTTFIGEGFSQNYNANNDSTWTNYTMAAGGYALGGLFKRLSSGGVRDLVFQWNDANQSTFTSVVNYVGAGVSTPEPGSVSMIAMGAMAMLGRRRRRSTK